MPVADDCGTPSSGFGGTNGLRLFINRLRAIVSTLGPIGGICGGGNGLAKRLGRLLIEAGVKVVEVDEAVDTPACQLRFNQTSPMI